MIRIEVEYDELSDGSEVYDVTIYHDADCVCIPCSSKEDAEAFRDNLEILLMRYAV